MNGSEKVFDLKSIIRRGKNYVVKKISLLEVK